MSCASDSSRSSLCRTLLAPPSWSALLLRGLVSAQKMKANKFHSLGYGYVSYVTCKTSRIKIPWQPRNQSVEAGDSVFSARRVLPSTVLHPLSHLLFCIHSLSASPFTPGSFQTRATRYYLHFRRFFASIPMLDSA